MSRPDNQEAWGRFWSNRRSSASGSLPKGLQKIDLVQRQHWHAFARSLAKGARVLDLGTGDGVVLGKMSLVRPDLKLVGVDSSPSLPPSPRRMILKPRVEMERLPFPDASFDAVVSQFGLEYADTSTAALEVGRVLRPDGRLQLIVHHRSGPIVAHNLPRREALAWASSPDQYLEKARALVRARARAQLPTPEFFVQAPHEARRRYPSEVVATEFVGAILETLELGRAARPSESLEVLQALEERAGNEIARIDALERVACDAGGIDTILKKLRAGSVEAAEPREIFEEGAQRPFAWLLSGYRKGQ